MVAFTNRTASITDGLKQSLMSSLNVNKSKFVELFDGDLEIKNLHILRDLHLSVFNSELLFENTALRAVYFHVIVVLISKVSLDGLKFVNEAFDGLSVVKYSIVQTICFLFHCRFDGSNFRAYL